MSDQPDPSAPNSSGGDYLKNLFAQTDAAPLDNDYTETDTANPALTGDSILDLLDMTKLEFLKPDLMQGETRIERPSGAGESDDILFAEYQCPDQQSAGQENVDLAEYFEVEIAIPNHMSAGITLIFNEDIARYQLDSMHLQLEDENPINIDCNSGNDTEIYNFLRSFSLIATRIVNRDCVSAANINLMRQFYDSPSGTPSARFEP